MKNFSKTQNTWMLVSKRKKMDYPKINAKPKRRIGSMKGGFDQALLHLGVVIADEEPEVIEE